MRHILSVILSLPLPNPLVFQGNDNFSKLVLFLLRYGQSWAPLTKLEIDQGNLFFGKRVPSFLEPG